MSKKSQNDYPSGSRTSWKVVLTYLFVFALSCALGYYILTVRNTIDNQKANIVTQNIALARTNQFTQKVHEAQTAANLYAFTDNSKYRRQFNELCEELSAEADSILMTDISEENKQMVGEITGLVKSKGNISRQMSRLFNDFNPLAEFDRTIDEYQPPQMVDEIIVNTISKDTIIHVPKNKAKNDNFWQRLGHAFSPVIEEDSIIHLTLQKTDTIHYQRQLADTVNILADLRQLSDKAKMEYIKKFQEDWKEERDAIRKLQDEKKHVEGFEEYFNAVNEANLVLQKMDEAEIEVPVKPVNLDKFVSSVSEEEINLEQIATLVEGGILEE